MQYSAPIWTQFYEKMAFLFYSIASCDGHIAAQESASVKQQLREVWLDFESSSNEYGDDAAYQVETVFDWLLDAAPSSDDAFGEFKSFVKEHPGFITAPLRETILSSSKHVASSFYGTNSSEQKLLSELEDVLGKE